MGSVPDPCMLGTRRQQRQPVLSSLKFSNGTRLPEKGVCRCEPRPPDGLVVVILGYLVIKATTVCRVGSKPLLKLPVSPTYQHELAFAAIFRSSRQDKVDSVCLGPYELILGHEGDFTILDHVHPNDQAVPFFLKVHTVHMEFRV